MKNKTLRAFLIALPMLFLTQASWAAAGAIVSAGGQTTLERGGKLYRLVQKSAVESGDILRTGDNGFVYFKMKNGEEMFLQPNTEFKIDLFTPPTSPAAPATGKSFYTLAKGAFRAITHSLGQRDVDSYKVKAGVATMGIRGSIIVASFDGQTLQFGVESGGGSLSTNGGNMNLNAGQAAQSVGGGAPTSLPGGIPSSLQGPWTFDQAVTVNTGGGGAAGNAAAASGATGVATSTLVIGGIAVVGAVAAISSGGGNNGPTATTTGK